MSQQKNTDMARYFYRASAVDFMKIPGSPVAYFATQNVGNIFQKCTSIGEISKPRQGMATTNDEIFLRLWPEVSQSNVSFDSKNRDNARNTGKKWFPFLKGGGCRS